MLHFWGGIFQYIFVTVVDLQASSVPDVWLVLKLKVFLAKSMGGNSANKDCLACI